MPELPEVQTIVNQLGSRIVGSRIADIEIKLPKIFIGDRHKVLGTKITGVERRAKIILIHLDNDYTIAVHLKMTGQLVYGEVHGRKPFTVHGKNEPHESTVNSEPVSTESYFADTVSFARGIGSSGMALPNKHTQVIFTLADSGRGQNDGGGMLFFNDMRKFGWVRVISNQEARIMNQKYGPEPFSKEFTTEYLTKILKGWGRSVKLLLTDQEKIAGIGNIYANEALWYSEINPNEKGSSLSSSSGKVKKLYENIKKVLEMGIKYQGASDNSYVDAAGEKGSMQDHFMVYRQTGKPCKKCGTKIEMSRIGGRGTFFCPKCQG